MLARQKTLANAILITKQKTRPQPEQPTRKRAVVLKQHSGTSWRSAHNGPIVRQPHLCCRPPTSSPLRGEVGVFQLNRHPGRGESIFARLIHFSWTRRELSLRLPAKALKGREGVWSSWRWTCLQRSGVSYRTRLISSNYKRPRVKTILHSPVAGSQHWAESQRTHRLEMSGAFDKLKFILGEERFLEPFVHANMCSDFSHLNKLHKNKYKVSQPFPKLPETPISCSSPVKSKES